MLVPSAELSTVTNEEVAGVSCVCFGRVGEGNGCEFGFLFFLFFFPASEQDQEEITRAEDSALRNVLQRQDLPR